jgi:hypothetical protein
MGGYLTFSTQKLEPCLGYEKTGYVHTLIFYFFLRTRATNSKNRPENRRGFVSGSNTRPTPG